MKTNPFLTGLAMLACAGSCWATDFHVSQAAGASDDNPGTAAKPWRTLTKAGAMATAGDVVRVHAGIYRDCLTISNSGTDKAPITFAAAGDGDVVVSGADVVDGFQQEGKFWVKKPWPHRFTWYWGAESTYPDVANRNSPFMSAGRMENVFVNGNPLQWVPSVADLAPGRFFWKGDAAGEGELRIQPPEGMASPAHVTIEVPLRGCVLSGSWGNFPRGISELRNAKKESDPKYPPCDYIVIRGLTFGYTCEGFVTAGALIAGDHWTIEDSSFQYMNATGLWMGGDDAVVRRCRFMFNGKTGISSKFRLQRALIEDCLALQNNRKFYKIDWDAGGIKLHNVTDSTIRRLTTASNYGAALWFDIDCVRNTIEDSVSLGNDGLGFFYEISDAGTFRNNVSFGNGVGIMYAHSADGVLEDNAIIGCSVGYILGGDRGQYKGVNNAFRSNIVLNCSGRNVDWKGSKNPDGRVPASKNMIVGNTFVTENGSTSFGLYSPQPDLAAFEAAYKNAAGNRAISRLEAVDAATRRRLDWAMQRTLESLNAIEPRLRLSAAAAHLDAIWPLGGKGSVTGYWIKTANGHVLVLTVAQEDSLSLVSPDARNATLWNFAHLGPHSQQALAGRGNVLTAHPTGGLAVITGLAAATNPLGELVTLAATQQGVRKTTFKQGEDFQVDMTLANPLSNPIRLTVSGPGLPPSVQNLAPGASKQFTVPEQAQPGTNGLVFTIQSDMLGMPLEQSIPLQVTRQASASRNANPKAPPTIVIDSSAQRNTRIWDEDSGQSWEGPADLSAQGAVTWDDAGLTTALRVTDNRVVTANASRGVDNSDGIELFLDGRTGKAFRSPAYGAGVMHLRLAAPEQTAWQELRLAARALVSNGDFHAGLADWYLPQGSTAQVVTEAGNPFARIQANSIIQRDVLLDPAWGRLRVTCRARYENIVPGTLSWHVGRLMVDFKDKAGKHAGAWPDMITFRSGTRAAWSNEVAEYDIPADATLFRLQAGMWSVKSGTLDIDDIVVTPIANRAGKPMTLDQAEGVTARGRLVDGGYEARVTVAWACLPGFTPQAGASLGFDVAVDDVDNPAARSLTSQLVWQGSAGLDASDPSQFGFVTLAP